MCEQNNKPYLSEVIDYDRDILPYRFIKIFAGVGSGKNIFVDHLIRGDLFKHTDGSLVAPKTVLLITSRRAKVNEQLEDEETVYDPIITKNIFESSKLEYYGAKYDQGVEYDYDAVVEEEPGNTFQTDLFIAAQADEVQPNLEEEPLTPQTEPSHGEELPETDPSLDTTSEGSSISPAEYDGAPSEETQAGSEDASNSSGMLAIEDVRVLIGNDRNNRPVHWEFGHKNLANRHLLITGGSGQGKTYAIQTFLFELARQKISSVVFDYTDGFLPDKLEPPFAEALLLSYWMRHKTCRLRMALRHRRYYRRDVNMVGLLGLPPSSSRAR